LSQLLDEDAAADADKNKEEVKERDVEAATFSLLCSVFR